MRFVIKLSLGGESIETPRRPRKFAGPLARGVSDPVFNLLYSNSLIIVRPQGPQWAKLGRSDTGRIPVREENRSQSFVFGLFGPRRPSKSAREAIFKVPERACARSWLPWCFLNDFWLQKIAILASKMTFFVNVFWPRWVFVGHWFLVGFRYASPLKFSRFGRCAKKAQMAFDL